MTIFEGRKKINRSLVLILTVFLLSVLFVVPIYAEDATKNASTSDKNSVSENKNEESENNTKYANIINDTDEDIPESKRRAVLGLDVFQNEETEEKDGSNFTEIIQAGKPRNVKPEIVTYVVETSPANENTSASENSAETGNNENEVAEEIVAEEFITEDVIVEMDDSDLYGGGREILVSDDTESIVPEDVVCIFVETVSEDEAETVPADVVTISVPTIPDSDETVFDYTVDPQHLLNLIDDGEQKLYEADTTLFFKNYEGEYEHSRRSDLLTVNNTGKVPVNVHITVSANISDNNIYSDNWDFYDENGENHGNSALYFALVDDQENEVPMIDGMIDFSFRLDCEDITEYNFGLTGNCNSSWDWKNNCVIPVITVQWRIEPIRDEEAEEETDEESVSENSVSENTVAEETVSENSVDEDTASEEVVSENSIDEGAFNEGTVSRNTIENGASEETVSRNTIVEDDINEETIRENNVEETLIEEVIEAESVEKLDSNLETEEHSVIEDLVEIGKEQLIN